MDINIYNGELWKTSKIRENSDRAKTYVFIE